MDAYLDGLLDELVTAEPREAWSDVLGRAGGRRIVASRRAVIVAIAIAAILTAGGLATARAAGVISIFEAPHRATIELTPSTLVGNAGEISNCRLVGETADQVATMLASSGIGIEWRFQDWGSVTGAAGDGSPAGDQQAVEANARTGAIAASGGDSTAVSSVPGDSIVWNALPDNQEPNEAFVFVEAPNDPNAPQMSLAACP